MAVRRSNAELMAFVAEAKDISEVENAKTNKGRKVEIPPDQMLIRLPTNTAGYLKFCYLSQNHCVFH